MTVYIFDKDKKVRAPVADGDAVDLIHDENNRSITVSVKKTYQVKTGEYVGFLCVDGHFRLFCVTVSALDDAKGVHDLTATDAIVQEMKEAIIEEKQQLDVPLDEALSSLVPDSTWTVLGTGPDRLEKSRAYFTSLWTMVTTLEQLYEWRVDSYYTFESGEIVSRVLEMMDPAPVFRGRILESGKDASKVYITSTGRPITRLYGLGAAQGTQDEPKNLTFADAVWSVENGDPVDKPKGQTWVEDPQAVEENGLHTDTFYAQDAENAEDLLKRTWEELQKRKTAAVTLKATVADMEMVPGYSHMQIRLGDLVAVFLKDGTSVEAKIIAIKRHYFRPWLTTITIGEKTATIQTQVSSLITSATHTFERLTIYKNRFHEDEALIQLNAEHIQLNATTILEHAEQIVLLAEEDNQVKLILDGVTGELTAQAEAIRLNAEEISAVSDRIDLQADEIFLRAKTYVDELITEYATIEELTAQKAYVDNLVTQYATLSEFEALRGQVADLEAGLGTLTVLNVGTVNADDILTTYLNAASFTHAGAIVSQRAITMGDVSTTGSALSTGGALDLQHSHAVTVNGDGTITLGEVSSSGGSFNIADTKFYQDGVSAAYNRGQLEFKPSNVTVTPAINGAHEYLLSVALTNVYGNAVITFNNVVMDAREAYDNGYDDGYDAGYQAAKDAVTVVGGITSITNTAANYMYAQGWARASLDGEQLDYTTFSGSQYFPNLGQ